MDVKYPTFSFVLWIFGVLSLIGAGISLILFSVAKETVYLYYAIGAVLNGFLWMTMGRVILYLWILIMKRRYMYCIKCSTPR